MSKRRKRPWTRLDILLFVSLAFGVLTIFSVMVNLGRIENCVETLDFYYYVNPSPFIDVEEVKQELTTRIAGVYVPAALLVMSIIMTALEMRRSHKVKVAAVSCLLLFVPLGALNVGDTDNMIVSWHGEDVLICLNQHGNNRSETLSDVPSLQRWRSQIRIDTQSTTFAAVYGEVVPKYIYHFTDFCNSHIGATNWYGWWLAGGVHTDENQTLTGYIEVKIGDDYHKYFSKPIPYNESVCVSIWRSGVEIDGEYWSCKVKNFERTWSMKLTVMFEPFGQPIWHPHPCVFKSVAGTEVKELPSTNWSEFSWMSYLCDNCQNGMWENTLCTQCSIEKDEPYIMNVLKPFYKFIVPSIWNYRFQWHNFRQVQGFFYDYTIFSCEVGNSVWKFHSHSITLPSLNEST